MTTSWNCVYHNKGKTCILPGYLQGHSHLLPPPPTSSTTKIKLVSTSPRCKKKFVCQWCRQLECKEWCFHPDLVFTQRLFRKPVPRRVLSLTQPNVTNQWPCTCFAVCGTARAPVLYTDCIYSIFTQWQCLAPPGPSSYQSHSCPLTCVAYCLFYLKGPGKFRSDSWSQLGTSSVQEDKVSVLCRVCSYRSWWFIFP